MPKRVLLWASKSHRFRASVIDVHQSTIYLNAEVRSERGCMKGTSKVEREKRVGGKIRRESVQIAGPKARWLLRK